MRQSLLVTVVAGLLAACAGEPSSPSPSNDPYVVQAASFGTLFTIEPRRIHLDCGLNEQCTLQVTITASRQVNLSWSVNTTNVTLGGYSCPSGPFLGSCTLDFVIQPRSEPGRVSGTVEIRDLDSGVGKILRVSGKIG